MRWVSAQDLIIWADRLPCRAALPELIRRLAWATITSPERVHFPSDESIQRPGWDGIIRAPSGNQFVPQGCSGWELSTEKGTDRKANREYESRTRDSLELERSAATFVFATPRRWNQKQAWAKKKRAKREWANVLALDADDLEHWLELAPAVGAWLAKEIGVYPDGVLSLDDFRTEFSSATKPPLSPEIVLAGRAADADRVIEWLRRGTGVFHVTAESTKEAFAFIAAAVTVLEQGEQDQVHAKFLLADRPTILRELSTVGNHLTIGWLTADTTSVGIALQRGHRVIIATATPNPADSAKGGDRLTLSHPDRDSLHESLLSAGIDDARASALIREVWGSITVLHRRLAIAPNPPDWATPNHARSLIPAVLTIAWKEGGSSEQATVGRVWGLPYEEVAATMARWFCVSDAPVQSAGGVWAVRAPYDAWHLLYRYITGPDLERHRDAVAEVLGVRDPRLDLEPSHRGLANLCGKEFPHSFWLRRGLSQAVLLISLTDRVAGQRGSDVADHIVHSLLEDDWERWYSLCDVLPILAEAAPAVFVDRLDEVLNRDDQRIDLLFEVEGPMGGDRSGGLFMALELLAWNPDHLTSVSLAAARIARTHERADEFLRTTFLAWRPQTRASVEQRSEALNRLVEREPHVGWRLLMNLWPTNQDFSARHCEPIWPKNTPPFQPSADEGVNAKRAVVKAALNVAGQDPVRLRDLIGKMAASPPEALVQMKTLLTAFAEEEHDHASRQIVWSALRSELNKHRRFPESPWSQDENTLRGFDPILDALTPPDLLEQHAWLFQEADPTLPFPDPEFQLTPGRLAERRRAAVEVILAQRGIEGIRALAVASNYPFILGESCTSVGVDEEGVLRFLQSEDNHLRECGRGYAYVRHKLEGIDWVDRTLELHPGWDNATRAVFLHAMPPDRTIWVRVERHGAVKEYWQQLDSDRLHHTGREDLDYMLDRLILANQVVGALELAGRYAEGIPTVVLTLILDKVFLAIDGQSHRFYHPGYHISCILNALDKRLDMEAGMVARYEWIFFPFVRHERPLQLHDQLCQSPEFFAQLIATIYRGDEEHAAEAPTPDEVARAKQAEDLLDSWLQLPGKSSGDVIDGELLMSWVERARALCSGRLDGCDRSIGRLLAYSPRGLDRNWPCEAVRAVIERVNTRGMERGFHAGIYNKRGTTVSEPFAGGDAERQLAAQYRTWEHALAPASPRTARVLRQIAEEYEREAHREDLRAEQRRML